MKEATAPAPRLTELAHRFGLIKQELESLKLREQGLKDEQAALEMELRPELEALEATKISLEGVGTLYLKTTFHASLVKGQEEALNAWLDARGLGDLAKRRVHHKTLDAEYQRWQDEDCAVPPAELVTSFNEVRVVLRKA